MRSKLKRMLAVMLIAAMTTIPAITSLADEMPQTEFPVFAGIEGMEFADAPPYPFDASFPFWQGWGFGTASPSDMIPGFMPGDMQEPTGGNPDGSTFPNDFKIPQDNAFAPGDTFFPGIMPPADPQDEFYIPAEANIDVVTDEADAYVYVTETEAEEDSIAAEEGVWFIEADDDDTGNGDYVKFLVYNLDNRIPADTLLTDYIERLFYGEPDTTIFTDYWRSTLNYDEQYFYDNVKDFAEEIAASDEVYPVFDAAASAPVLSLTKNALGLSDDASNTRWCEAALDYYMQNAVNVRQVIDYVYRDSPAYFYWADKSYAILYSATVVDDRCEIVPSSVYFLPDDEWEGDYAGQIGRYIVCNVSNEDLIAARNAAENAWEIVEDHREESENVMMASFEEAVARLITYDTEEDADSSDYDDPWMLVYVFDDDPLTTVTDVGYAKAVSCLRKMSGLDDEEADAE